MWNLHKSDKTQMPAGLEDPVLMEGCGHIGRLRLRRLASVPHDDRRPGGPEHLKVVCAVPEGDCALCRDAQKLRDLQDAGALAEAFRHRLRKPLVVGIT